MKRLAKSTLVGLIVLVAVCFVGCAGPVPYRDAGLEPNAKCDETYSLYNVGEPEPFKRLDARDPCWRRGIEEHPTFDLLFVEFTDQGWVQESSSLTRPSADYVDRFMKKLDERRSEWAKQGRGLSLVVYVHGWQNNAKSDNENVVDFRRLLNSMAWMETHIATKEKVPSKRVVGIYVGWRGKSLDIPGLNVLTFWERKNTAEHIAQGTVRELLKKLDLFRDTARGADGKRDVRMLTIGHSFGGLITYSSLGSEFVRNAVRFKEHREGRMDRFMSRVGDLVVLVNPAFEGARYEPLHTAGQRLCGVEPDQLPVLVVATSEADAATSTAFPIAERLYTLFQTTQGNEGDAVVKTVGHNERYQTHALVACRADQNCLNATCKAGPDPAPSGAPQVTLDVIDAEYGYMQRIVNDGFGKQEYLCGGLSLTSTAQWHPKNNPYWVVRTSEEVIGGHSDLFNANFITFVRQIYLGLIFARESVPASAKERNPCRPG